LSEYALQLLWTACSECGAKELRITPRRRSRLLCRTKIKITGRGVIPVRQISGLIQEISKYVIIMDDDGQNRNQQLSGKLTSKLLHPISVLLITNRVENHNVLPKLRSNNSPTAPQSLDNLRLGCSF